MVSEAPSGPKSSMICVQCSTEPDDNCVQYAYGGGRCLCIPCYATWMIAHGKDVLDDIKQYTEVTTPFIEDEDLGG